MKNEPAELGATRTLFVTGTDTGVGKTVLTGLLLRYLRDSGVNALAMKPFSAGGLEDANLLNDLQDNALLMDEVAPFRFDAPVAPYASMRKGRRDIPLRDILGRIRRVEQRCDRLLVEGVGGVLVPLGQKLRVADIIRGLGCPVIVVAADRLGVINHTLLTVEMLCSMGVKHIKVVLMGQANADESSVTNEKILRELLAPVSVFKLPCFGRAPLDVVSIKYKSKKNKKTLARLCDLEYCLPRSFERLKN